MYTRLLSMAVLLVSYRVVAAPQGYLRPTAPPMDLLTKTMTGQRVLAAGRSNWSAPVPEKEMAKATTVIGRLQAIGDAASSPENRIIPYVLLKSWVLAPETREEVTLDVSGIALSDALPRTTNLELALTTLTKDQVVRLGSESGLAVSEMSQDAQTAFLTAFRPPLDIVDQKAGTTSKSDSAGAAGTPEVSVREFTTPLDPSRIRIRAYLIPSLLGFDAADGQLGFIFIGSTSVDRWPRFELHEDFSPIAGGEPKLPFLHDVPNRFKPSDLDGRGYAGPIGIQGAFWLPDVLKQLAKVTGLHLRGASGYRDTAVFIGTERMECGEVMDGLRLALTASWRKLGDTYILAWDRRGLGALQLLAQENALALRDRIGPAYQGIDTSPGWLTLAYNLPFAPDDPLTLTEKQRHALFDPIWNLGDGVENQPRLKFADMTPEQQTYVCSLVGKAEVYLRSASSGANQTRPMGDGDVAKTYMTGGCNLDLRIEVPGTGWVAAPPNWLNGAIASHRLSEAHKRANGAPATATPFLKLLQTVKPCPLPAETRGLMVPVLTPARLKPLSDEMSQHGLNTLFYPVLYDGYSTIPSPTFPPYPSLAGEDGYATAVRLMRPAGIRVIGYVSMLAWRNAGDKSHWLDAHPEWIDTDVAGRPRRELVLRDKALGRRASLLLHAPGNAVRPTEPDVVSRLKAFVAEFARRKDADAVAFTDVCTDCLSSVESDLLLPPLGYALPDRIAAVKAGEDDPVDDYLTGSPWEVPFTPKSPGANCVRASGNAQGGTTDQNASPCAALLSMLIEHAKTVHKGVKTWLVDSENGAWYYGQAPAPDSKSTKPDVTVPSEQTASNRTMLIQVEAHDAYWKADTPDAERAIPAMAHAMMGLSHPGGFEGIGKGARFSAIILDFRTCPEDITDALKWVTPGPALSR